MIPLNTHEAFAHPLTLTRGAEFIPAVHISSAVAVAVPALLFFWICGCCTAGDYGTGELENLRRVHVTAFDGC